MFQNLEAEMVRRGVTTSAIAKIINKTEKSTRAKIMGRYPFTLPEAKKVRDTYFQGFDLDYLFAVSCKNGLSNCDNVQ